jgi:protein tyrosine phosphatase (PTP) superfamily phosphohydrolase (DUF442 family)
MRLHPSPVVAVLLLAAVFGSRQAAAQQVTKQTVPGVSNFAKLETTVACGGATTPEAVPELKKMGFASIINLRLPSEAGANVEGEAAAAKTAGINFFNIPFSGASPDPAVADKFLATITAKGNEPAYIHCAAGNRSSSITGTATRRTPKPQRSGSPAPRSSNSPSTTRNRISASLRSSTPRATSRPRRP